tara:strand:+ start:1660 stop:1833 length:174 start_codon:yes stop_codon:yes gene_type:complete
LTIVNQTLACARVFFFLLAYGQVKLLAKSSTLSYGAMRIDIQAHLRVKGFHIKLTTL